MCVLKAKLSEEPGGSFQAYLIFNTAGSTYSILFTYYDELELDLGNDTGGYQREATLMSQDKQVR